MKEDEIRERDKAVYALHLQNTPTKDISIKYNIKPTRVREVIKQEKLNEWIISTYGEINLEDMPIHYSHVFLGKTIATWLRKAGIRNTNELIPLFQENKLSYIYGLGEYQVNRLEKIIKDHLKKL